MPVDWVDDPDSRVDLWRTAVDDLRGIARVGWSLARGRVPLVSKGPWPPAGTTSLPTQVMRFLGIGVLSTIAYALVFLLLRSHTDAVVANVLALLSTTMLNTAANRMWTFGVRGRVRAVTHQAQGLLVLAAGLAVTTLALSLASDAGFSGTWPELAVLTVGEPARHSRPLRRLPALGLPVTPAGAGVRPAAGAAPACRLSRARAAPSRRRRPWPRTRRRRRRHWPDRPRRAPAAGRCRP